MTTESIDHAWTQDHLTAFLADGLDAAERERLQAHLQACAECVATLESTRSFDTSLSNFFTNARPSALLEDRTLSALRTPITLPSKRAVWFRRITVGLAATASLAAIGSLGVLIVNNDGLPMPGQVLAAAKNTGRIEPLLRQDATWITNQTGDSNRSLQRFRSTAQPTMTASEMAERAIDLTNADNGLSSESVDLRSAGEGFQAIDRVQNTPSTPQFQSTPNAGGTGSTNQQAQLAKQNPSGLGGGGIGGFGGAGFGGGIAGSVRSAGAGALGGGPRGGRGPGAAPGLGGPVPMSAPNVGGQPPVNESKPGSGKLDFKDKDMGAAAGRVANAAEGDKLGKDVLPALTQRYFAPSDVRRNTGTTDERNELRQQLAILDGENDKPAAERPVKEMNAPKGEGGAPRPASSTPSTPRSSGTSGTLSTAGGVVAAPAEQQPIRKIIIRSGEIDFEVESFDSAVAAVTLLVTKIPGGYVGTVNSEKLANGKVKGSVVVRVPPDTLDNFVLELRKDLGKTGELKGQRIGSQDITKMYTDLESRLKAARAMETRLLAIIKDGKGEIKQLLEAEKELGVWRTKIEEYEGELRYYGNLASLSTLTITLAEKEIRTAAGITEQERVQTGIEVEDVDKSFRDAMAAVFEAKGRVTKSELKQLAAGQFNAVLNFEVSPDAAGPLRDRLKQLGRVARLEIDRQQTTDGGTPTKDAKVKRGDTVFFVQFYNLANIAPRETTTIRLAANDVAASYRILREAIEKVKGRVLTASINNDENLEVSGQIDFEVKRVEDGAIVAALAANGEVVSKTATRAAESDAVTDTKILYRITIFNTAKLEARETTQMHLAVVDVPKTFRTIQDAIEKAKGRIIDAQLYDSDQQNTPTELEFELKRSDELTLQQTLTTAGELLDRNTVRAADSANVTDAKVKYHVMLHPASTIQPRETSIITYAVTDIPKGFREIKEAVEKAKGRIITSNLNEGDKENITAQLDFHVNRSDDVPLVNAMHSSGDVLARQTSRAAESKATTDTKILYRVTFVNAMKLKPRETTTLAIEVADVEATAAIVNTLVSESKGRVIDSQSANDRAGRRTVKLVYDVPLAAAVGIVERVKNSGEVRVHQSQRDPNATDGKYATARLSMTISNIELIIPKDDGVWPQVRKGLSYSASALLSSVSWVIFGVCVVLPWVVVGYGGYRLVRRLFRKTSPTSAQ